MGRPLQDEEFIFSSRDAQAQVDALSMYWEHAEFPGVSFQKCFQTLMRIASQTSLPKESMFELIILFDNSVKEWQRELHHIPPGYLDVFNYCTYDRAHTKVKKRVSHLHDDTYLLSTMSGESISLPHDIVGDIAHLSEWEFFNIRRAIQSLSSEEDRAFFGEESVVRLEGSPLFRFFLNVPDGLPKVTPLIMYPLWWTLSPLNRNESLLLIDNEFGERDISCQLNWLANRVHLSGKGLVNERFVMGGNLTRWFGKAIHLLIQNDIRSTTLAHLESLNNATNVLQLPNRNGISPNGRNGKWFKNFSPEYIELFRKSYELLRNREFLSFYSRATGIDLDTYPHIHTLDQFQTFEELMQSNNGLDIVHYLTSAMMIIRMLLNSPNVDYSLHEKLFPGMPGGVTLSEVSIGKNLSADMIVVPKDLYEKLSSRVWMELGDAWKMLLTWDQYAHNKKIESRQEIHIVEIKTVLNLRAPQWEVHQGQIRGLPKAHYRQILSYLGEMKRQQFQHLIIRYHLLRVAPEGLTWFYDLQTHLADHVVATDEVTSEQLFFINE